MYTLYGQTRLRIDSIPSFFWLFSHYFRRELKEARATVGLHVKRILDGRAL